MSGFIQGTEEVSPRETFGKASLANAVFGLSGFVSTEAREVHGLARVGPFIHLKPSQIRLWKGVCPGPWQTEGKTEGGRESDSWAAGVSREVGRPPSLLDEGTIPVWD